MPQADAIVASDGTMAHMISTQRIALVLLDGVEVASQQFGRRLRR